MSEVKDLLKEIPVLYPNLLLTASKNYELFLTHCFFFAGTHRNFYCEK